MSETTDSICLEPKDPLLIITPKESNLPTTLIQDECKTEWPEDTQSTSQDAEMLDMFASVWVKIEVNENETDQEDSSYVPSENSQYKKTNKKPNNHKTLQCPECDYTTKYKNCLESHMYGHQNKKPFQCEFCTYATKYPGALHRHVMVKHREEKSKQLQEIESNIQVKPGKKYKCKQCPYETPYKWNLSSHKRAHRIKDEKRFRCELCEYATSFKHNIDKHKKVHEGTVYNCEKCPFTTKYEGHLTRHMVKIHNEDIAGAKLFRCEHCPFGTKHNWRLTIHKNRMRRDVPINCSHCDFETYFRCESKLHKNAHFPVSRPVGCSDDINRFINDKLKQSEGIIDANNQISDNYDSVNENERNTDLSSSSDWNKSDVNPLTLRLPGINVNSYNLTTLENEGVTPKIDSHGQANNYIIDPRGQDWNSIDVIETSDLEKPFACTACSYTAKFKASVQRHYQRLHTDNKHKPYKCTNCDFSTKTKDQIALHNKRSQSDVSLSCQTCQFTTFYKCTFAMHQKTHYEHKCALCNHKTKHKHDMQSHVALKHMGVGVKCRFCNFKTTRKDALLTHEVAHTGLKPFRCSFCDYSAIRRALLLNHYTRYHDGNVPVLDKRNTCELRQEICEDFRTDN